MQNSTFWTNLGNFWEKYDDKPTIEHLWGAWTALTADQHLQLDQINLSKNIFDIPLYWRKLWVPIDVDVDKIVYDTLSNSNEYTVPTIELVKDDFVSLGFTNIFPGTIKCYDENRAEVDLDNFEINYLEGLVKLKSGSSIDDGTYVTFTFSQAEYSVLADGKLSFEHKNIKYASENIFYIPENRFLKRRIDYTIDYSSGQVTLNSSNNFYDEHNFLISYEYLNLTTEYPYKYRPPEHFLYTGQLFLTPQKNTGSLELNTHFIYDGEFLRFKEPFAQERVWSEEAIFSTDNIYRVFGSRVGFLDENSLEYYKAVLGLIFFLQHAPTPTNLAGGCSAILGTPFSYLPDKVLSIDTSDPTDYKVITEKMVYSTGSKLPIVYPGQTLSSLQPLTDDIKIYDGYNTPNLHEMLLQHEIHYTDKGLKADTDLLADSMWSVDGKRRLFMRYHTFVVEVKDPSLFSNREAINKVRYMLQHKSARTTYFFLFNLYLEDLFQKHIKDHVTADIHDLLSDGWLGTKVAEEFFSTPMGHEKVILSPRFHDYESHYTLAESPVYTVLDYKTDPKEFKGTINISSGMVLNTNLVLFDTVKIFGVNVKSNLVDFSVSAHSDYNHGEFGLPATYVENISRAFIRGKDFVIDEETGIITIPAGSLLFEGQKVYAEYKYMDLDVTEVEIKDTDLNLQINDSFDQGRERITLSEHQGVFTREDIYFGNMRPEHAYLAEHVMARPNGYPDTRHEVMGAGEFEFGAGTFGGTHGAPKCFRVVARDTGDALRLDWLPDIFVDNTDLDAQQLDHIQIVDILPESFIDSLGDAPYLHRFKLPAAAYFITRLSSMEGIGTKYRELEYLETHDFIVDKLSYEKQETVIRFKNLPQEGSYYAFRFGPDEIPYKKAQVTIQTSDFVNSTGKAPFVHKYTFTASTVHLTKLTKVTPYAEIELLRGKDFFRDDATGFIYLKELLSSDTTFWTWDYNDYAHPYRFKDRKKNATESFKLADKIASNGAAPYFYRYRLSKNYTDIYTITSEGDILHPRGDFTYKKDTHFKVVYRDGDYEINFKAVPYESNYEIWHAIEKEIPDNSQNHEAIRYFDTENKQQYLEWDSREISIIGAPSYHLLDKHVVEGYFTERENTHTSEKRYSQSWVYRLTGPSVPRGVNVTAN